MSLTSVIMVTYNTGPVLFQAIASVLSQTEAVELCLVDNGNPAHVLDQIRSLAARDGRIHLITGQGNVGFSKGCNLGARSWRWVSFCFSLNPDSLLPLDTLKKLQVHAGVVKRPYMIGARVMNEDGTDQRGCRRALLTPTTAFIEALHLGPLYSGMRV